MALRISIYDVIIGPVITEKASQLVNKLKKVVLEVHPQANKPLVAEALEKLFNVKVRDVRIIVRKGKTRRFKRMEIHGKISKRAIVTLKDAHSFDILTQAGAGAVGADQVAPGSVSMSKHQENE